VIFNKMDANGDAKVTLEEFKAFRHTWNPEEIFKQLDTNHDGFLSLNEFKAGPMAQKAPAKAEEIHKRMDANGDGKVTLEEFKAYRPHHGNHGGNDKEHATPVK